ncbi:hypothetical protein N7476_004743 [Penicillium atrosanguineum]|uniref:Uncharacterized protein n=1 Tax=Penicillium atrosanguineum TaxID=1132637 RepID=A0A9W9PY20_9EURO|nr:hypothetical protein N7476_004743 [Penicillium atrosanguineum]
MGRKLFFASKTDIAKEKRNKQLEDNGYVFGAHADEDSIREKDKRLPKTKKSFYQTVDLWMNFVEQQGIEGYKMGPGCVTPDHTLIKEFLHWYSHSARGKKAKNGRPVMTSVLNCAERLFGGFDEKLKIMIPSEDRSEVFNWIRRTLTASEGTIENVEDPDHSFTKKDFVRTISSMWQADHRRFMPGLLKAIVTLALQLYLFTGARIGAFIPAHEDRDERGLRYKHIDLVLFPSSTAPWKIEWKVNQVWLKGNRNPDYTVFGIGIRDTKRPQFASGYILLAIALQHGALYGIESVEDFANFDLSGGEPIELRWKEEFLEKPVLRNVTADGPQDVPLTKERFCDLLRGIITTAGYCKSITVHKIRKYLGSVVEGKHGSALVSQIYGHKDAGTYPKEYLLHCSSIDTVSAVLGEEEQSNHIEYFQGFERFYERGLPGELPAEIEASILQTPDLVNTRRRIEQLEASNGEKVCIAAEKLNYRKALIRLRLAGLKEYQKRWVREKRDQKILKKGKAELVVGENDVSTQAQFLLMPELARISSLMSSDRELSFDETLLFVDDLKTHCERDFDVAFLPQERPIQGCCPARDCLKDIKCLKKSARSAHIHTCVRREIAFDLQVSESQLKFCYECMKWLQAIQWQDHCSSHIQSWNTQHCEVIVYRHTVIRPGYCPFCLWNKDLADEDRLHQWLKSGNLKQHIEEKHMLRDQWYGAKPSCGCGQAFVNERDLRHHLHDIHKLNKAIWSNPKLLRKRKRTPKLEARDSSIELNEQPPKKLRFYRYPPPRHQHEHNLLKTFFLPTLTLGGFIEERPERLYNSIISGNSTEGSRSGSIVSCFSEGNSPFSSQPTTLGSEEVIDPRLLEPLPIGIGQPAQPNNQMFMKELQLKDSLDEQEVEKRSSWGAVAAPTLRTEEVSRPHDHIAKPLASLKRSSSEAEVKPISFNDTEQSEYSSPSIATCEAIDNMKVLQEVCSNSKSDDSRCSVTEREFEGHSTSHQKVSDGNMARAEDLAIGFRGPLTRAQKKERAASHRPSNPTKETSRKKLSAKDKRMLRELKSQNLTLRQIGVNFPDIDTVLLRQTWMDMGASQRCTRSRAKQRGG